MNLLMRPMQIAFLNKIRSEKSLSEWVPFDQPIVEGFHAGLPNLWIPHCQ